MGTKQPKLGNPHEIPLPRPGGALALGNILVIIAVSVVSALATFLWLVPFLKAQPFFAQFFAKEIAATPTPQTVTIDESDVIPFVLTKVEPSLVSIETGEGGLFAHEATGVVISEDGVIAAHSLGVNDASSQYRVRTQTGETLIVERIEIDPQTSIAFLITDGEKLTPLAIAKREEVRNGIELLAVAKRLAGEETAVAKGILSERRISFETNEKGAPLDRVTWFWRSAGIDNVPGLIVTNVRGELIGITAKSEGSYATIIPAAVLEGLRTRFASLHSLTRGDFPVRYAPLAAKGGEGITITEVPVDEEGNVRFPLEVNDRIITIDDQSVRTGDDLADLLRPFGEGDSVTLKVIRAGTEVSVDFKIP
ncbi:MAG: serine protease [Parcubacteria group bacterium]|nr:serine protease [Parcubacteria group bacterium]